MRGGAEVAVVGAGLAGIVTAERLGRQGVRTVIYEASERMGGRVATLRGYFDEEQLVERGGEFVSEDHQRLIALVDELGLELSDLFESGQSGSDEDGFFVLGARYPREAAEADFEPVRDAVATDLEAAPWPTRLDTWTEAARALDRMSARQWIESRVPGGTASPLGRLLDVAQTVEFGAETSDQSALNIVYALGFLAEGAFSPFGSSVERYRIRGGTDRVVTALASRLEAEIRFGHRLVRAAAKEGGEAQLSFTCSGALEEIAVPRVVLALPFSMLREVDISSLGLSDPKRAAIAELGMGRNAKLQLQFRDRHWLTVGSSGDTLADTGYQCTWDATLGQPGEAGILVNYRGGPAARLGGAAPETWARRALAQLESVLPGISARWNGKASLDDWGDAPYQKGAYSYYRVGQYTSFGGCEAVPEGPVHFAGEHTCPEFQGYMEGAVRSGERAAAEVLRTIGSSRGGVRWGHRNPKAESD